MHDLMNKKGLMDNDMVYIAAFILTFLSSLCRSDNQLTQTKPLLPKDTLISDGGDFALGFFSPTNSSKKLYIGIWYHRIAERTVVWVANRDSPITTPSAKLAITGDSELVLTDSQGHTLWTATPRDTGGGGGTGAGAATAVLLNSGNFVLRSPNGTGVWQSFDHPTDNILPSMRVVLIYKARPATRMVAWKGPDDPSTGDFSHGMDPATNLQLFIWKGSLPYFRFPVVDGNPVSGDMHQINGIDVILYQTVINTGEESYYMFTVSPGSPYTRLALDYTGKGMLLIWQSNTSSWATIFEVPNNSCDLYASCGPFGYCDRMEAVPTCRCPDGFELLDSLNFSRGCRRREALKCGKQQEDYFMAMPSLKLPDKFLHVRNRSFEQCAAECAGNCSCTAYAYGNLTDGTKGDTSRCLVWAGDLIDMEKEIFEEVLYIRLGKSPDQNRINLLSILLPIIACVLLVALGALLWAWKSTGKRQKKRRMLRYLNSMDESGDKNIVEFPFISFEKIAIATHNFSDCNMIGKGGFGKVYKGMLEGTKEVAVKRLSKGSGQGTEEFKNEVVLIAKLQHKNLVKLLGCCIHEDERLLVYEYLPNKSLDYFLFDSARKSMLQWPRRFKIIQGVARGIMYLHHDSRLTIIHRDLKSSNILLDKEMSPKISDFGMAKIFCGDDDQLQANTNRVVGTYGYMSPEYAMEGTFSVKSDTYSFGVLLLEIVSGLKISSSAHLIMDFSSLISYAWNIWKEGKIEDLVDSSIMENCSLDEVSRCIHIALLCVQDNPNCRPLMSMVVFMLENKMTPLPTPKQPMYFSVRDYYQPGKTVENKQLSINDISLTVLEGR